MKKFLYEEVSVSGDDIRFNIKKMRNTLKR